MRTRSASTGVALTGLVLTLLASAAAADTINVPKDHDTINAAFAAAADNDVVVITKGVYRENVLLQGRSGVSVRTKGKVVVSPALGGDGFTIRNCSNIEIRGVRVEDAADGIVIDTCQDVELSKFAVTSSDRHGVFAFGSSNVNLSRGKIVGCGRDGVSYADETANAPVNGGTISKMKIANCDEDGVDILGSNVVVTKCTVKNVGDDAFESDDQGASPGPVRFERCKAIGAEDEGFELGAPETTCIKCVAKNCDDDGFDIEADDCVLDNCNAIGSGNAGFSIDGVDNAKLTKCKSSKNEDQGFEFQFATNATLEKCSSKRAGEDGFELDNGTQNCVLTKCKASGSKHFDLDDESDGSNTFPGSKFRTVDPNDDLET